MFARYQRGVSLFGAVLLVGIVGGAAMMTLFSIRYERNLFSEAWSFIGSAMGRNLQQSSDMLHNAVKSDASVIRQCKNNEAVTYSNVACPAIEPSDYIVEVEDSQRTEPLTPDSHKRPKVEAAPKLKDDFIEKVVRY